MLGTVGWLRCAHCGHLVNPRSERCDVDHPLCSGEGCQPEGHAPGAPLAGPLAQMGALAAVSAQTSYMVDLASYQAGIDLAAVRSAGYDYVNIKTSQGDWYTHGGAVAFAEAAEALGMGISTFHWLDNSADGTAQARYCWQTLGAVIAAVGHPVALQVDCEDSNRPATYQILADFIAEITRLAGHLPYMYSGAWWATAAGRANWNVAALTPWLMAAPNSGYPGSYPGDQSDLWHAGYWGYGDLAAMQYAVGPIVNAGGGSISQTAIRDPQVWAAITGGHMLTQQDVDLLVPAVVNGVLNAGFTIPNWDNDPALPNPEPSSVVTALSVSQQRSYQAERRVEAVQAEVSAVHKAIDGMVAVTNQLLALLTSGGGNPDTATLLNAIDTGLADVKATESATVSALQKEVHDLRAQLAAAAQAGATALATPSAAN